MSSGGSGGRASESGSAGAGDWTDWDPHLIAKAIWEDRLVPDKSRRVPLKATLHEHPSFTQIFAALSKLVVANPSKNQSGKYVVYSLEGKRSECKTKGLAVRLIAPSGKPVVGEPFRFL